MTQTFAQFTTEATNDDRVKIVMQAIGNQVRRGSAPVSADGQTRFGYWTIVEFADLFNTRWQAVRQIIKDLDASLRAKGITLEYKPGIKKPGMSGRNAFGNQGFATSTNIEARVYWTATKSVKESVQTFSQFNESASFPGILPKLVKLLGTTQSPDSTMFLLPDGTRLQWSNNRTSADTHAAACRIAAGLPNRAGQMEALTYVMSLGVIRYTSHGVEVGRAPTEVQAAIVADDFSIALRAYDLHVDVVGPDGQHLANRKFTLPVTADAFRNWVKSVL